MASSNIGHTTKANAIDAGRKWLARQDEDYAKLFCENGLCYLGHRHIFAPCRCDEKLKDLSDI